MGRSDVVFRIFTQNIPGYNKVVLRALHEHGFPYSTIVSGRGHGPDQGGKPENSLVLDIAIEDYSPAIERKMVAAVQKICEKNGPKTEEHPEGGQGSVLLVRIPASVKLVKRRRAGEAGYYQKPVSFWGRRGNRPPRPEPTYRGKILLASGDGDWEQLLKSLAAVKRGQIIGFY